MASGKAPRTRSPNYPTVNLQTAVGYTRTLYETAQKHPYPLADAYTLWGTKTTSSKSNQLLGALRAFGLVTKDGTGAAATVSVTDSAQRIILRHPDAPRLLRQAALAPAIHSTLYEEMCQAGIPPEKTLEHYLVIDHDPPFNPKTVGSFLEEFKATLEFAQLSGGGSTVDTENGGDGEEGDHSTEPSDSGEREQDPETSTRPQRHAPRTPRAGSVQFADTFTLPEGQALIEWPRGLSAESYEDLESWLQIVLRKIKRSIGTSPDDPSE